VLLRSSLAACCDRVMRVFVSRTLAALAAVCVNWRCRDGCGQR
jgi:hypothetical protein